MLTLCVFANELQNLHLVDNKSNFFLAFVDT